MRRPPASSLLPTGGTAAQLIERRRSKFTTKGGEKEMDVGDVVVFHDPTGEPRNALVTAVWSETCVNLVLVSSDDAMQDTYGRQIARKTSVSHKSTTPVHGNYWRRLEEEPNAYTPPAAV